MTVHTTLEPAAASAAPAASSPAARARLRPAERRLLATLANGEEPALLLKTGTKADVGQWFRRGRVWVGCFPGRLVLFATGRRPYGERLECAQLGQSLYNFLTGELALAPATPAVRRLKLAPIEAQRVLAHISGKESRHA